MYSADARRLHHPDEMAAFLTQHDVWLDAVVLRESARSMAQSD